MQGKIKETVPKSGRTYEQLLNHYEVEKALARKLLDAPRHERRQILLTMYDELFAKVPDHPRLARRESAESTKANIDNKYKLLREYLSSSDVFLEFAPGDCKFAYDVSSRVKYVYGVDISDQRSGNDVQPDNFKHIVYDGYSIDIERDTVDIVFSDQLLEHLHPDDIRDHFKMVLRVLKKGGGYILRTPHNYAGPHDVSKYFSDSPEGFHLKEWTFTELFNLLENLFFTSFTGCLMIKGRRIVLNRRWLTGFERLISVLHGKLRKSISGKVLREVIIVARK